VIGEDRDLFVNVGHVQPLITDSLDEAANT
jgi:hypothetical protein